MICSNKQLGDRPSNTTIHRVASMSSSAYGCNTNISSSSNLELILAKETQ
ncbi:unnamed protein product [Musa acuminata subsp. malaccensis]|uniref:(wild Malaysian banana) hypothetical protein n=1 Tax=Musa acuminata subsp. malaccensis TaxID=214687 RepID=A0A8D6ZU53_MUSAM|nr:unnamed protein product [Musa acuminata subsp. malaccensis]